MGVPRDVPIYVPPVRIGQASLSVNQHLFFRFRKFHRSYKTDFRLQYIRDCIPVFILTFAFPFVCYCLFEVPFVKLDKIVVTAVFGKRTNDGAVQQTQKLAHRPNFQRRNQKRKVEWWNWKREISSKGYFQGVNAEWDRSSAECAENKIFRRNLTFLANFL